MHEVFKLRKIWKAALQKNQDKTSDKSGGDGLNLGTELADKRNRFLSWETGILKRHPNVSKNGLKLYYLGFSNTYYTKRLFFL